MSIPAKIHQIWIGEAKMPERHVEWHKKLVELHPRMECKIWDDLSLMADGLELGQYYRLGWSMASVSNFARLWLLKNIGGIYLDTDFEPLKPFGGLIRYEAVAAFQDGGRICNAFMGAEPNHPWITWQLENFYKYPPADAASGVYLATDAPRKGLTIIPSILVYPWMYDDPPEWRVPHEDSVLCHHWEGSWVKK